MTAWWVLLPALALSLIAFQQPTAQSLEGAKYVTIDGSKDPASIPEWAAWEDGFMIVDMWRGKESGLTEDLRKVLSPTEMAALEKEAAARQQSRAEMEARGETLKAALGITGMPTNQQIIDFNERAYPVELAYRRGLLDARDRLLAAFSAESQAALSTWVNDLKSGIKAYVPKANMERWRSPQ
jgi:hypothetical protein